MSIFIEVVKDNGKRILLNTNIIASIYETEGDKVLINLMDGNEIKNCFTATNYDQIKQQLEI